ncbi:MAG TPA: ATP-dependent sacrificial sulfur transferase LarE, partial [Bacteroidota bacterium]
MPIQLDPAVEKKFLLLRTTVQEMESIVIGYSGGVDSTLLLKVASDVLGDGVLAVIGRSETYPTREFEEAMRLARDIGASVEVVDTEETDVLKFRENPPDRCYYCKTELFGKLKSIAADRGFIWIADGTNADDVRDFRPGMKAVSEQGVRSPLLEVGLTKQEVRELSRHLELPTWNKPSFACLSSRFPYGYGITKENLMKIDNAETLLRDLGFRSFRVRQHDDKTARIEVGIDEIKRLMEDEVRQKIVAGLKDLGFTYVMLDLQGYRTGSMNEVLTIEV